MLPTHQRFNPANLHRVHYYPGLVMKQQFSVIYRLTEAGLQRQTLGSNRIHVGGVKLIVITTGMLRPIESGSGIFQQGLGIAGIRGKETDANADGSEEPLAVQ